eukprot:TRINITY_DN12055_c0_g1_i1.p3 TRINITY_DN12055_c0_g1~~TRINITY_DN12055_c0_g1_i1.p3  ORF type:complete len:233 (+),score=30.48 TRINITY_DN12055_c0_g1_i1:468-1166(+)
MEGWLLKRGFHNPSYKRRYCVLKQDTLTYYKSFGTPPKGRIVLTDCRLSLIHNDKKHPHAFDIHTGERVWHFAAASEDDLDKWVRKLESLVLQTEPSSFISSVEHQISEAMFSINKTEAAMLAVARATCQQHTTLCNYLPDVTLHHPSLAEEPATSPRRKSRLPGFLQRHVGDKYKDQDVRSSLPSARSARSVTLNSRASLRPASRRDTSLSAYSGESEMARASFYMDAAAP